MPEPFRSLYEKLLTLDTEDEKVAFWKEIEYKCAQSPEIAEQQLIEALKSLSLQATSLVNKAKSLPAV